MRILITGGSGFIGQALCQHFLKAGHDITIMSRHPEHARTIDARLYAVHDPAELSQPRLPEAIINLAGQNLGSGRWNRELKQQFIDSRIGVTRRVVEFIANAPVRPKVLLNGSAVGYYGARGDEKLTEEDQPRAEFQSRLCVEWEEAARKAEAYGVRVCRMRLGAVLSGEGGPLPSLLPPFRLGLGGYFGSGRQWLSWIHRQDLMHVMERLLEDDSLSGAFNCTAPHPETNKAFTRKIGAALHRPVWIRIPGWAVRLQAGEMARLFLTGQRVIPQRLMDAGHAFRYPRLEDALEEILQ